MSFTSQGKWEDRHEYILSVMKRMGEYQFFDNTGYLPDKFEDFLEWRGISYTREDPSTEHTVFRIGR